MENKLKQEIMEQNRNVINFWMSFFPELETEQELEKIVKRLLGVELAEVLCLREEEAAADSDWISDTYFHGCSESGSDELKKIDDGFQETIQWVYFFEPIMERYFEEYRQFIVKRNIIWDKESFLRNSLENLYEKLVNFSFRTLVMETNIASEEGRLEGEGGEAKGRYYCQVLLRDKEYLEEIYTVYPELIRLLDGCVRNTFQYLEEIIDTIENQERFDLEECGPLKAVEIGQGDTHNNGKSVAKLVFENTSVFYKPRPLVMEKKYTALQQWLEENVPNYR